MKQLKTYTIIGILFVIITGTLSHFFYDWSGNSRIVGFVTPINESVWEHAKLLFFPMLLYTLFMISRLREEYPCITSSLLFGLLAGTLLIPVLYYAYTAILGKNLLFLDIGIFLLSVLAAFRLSYEFTLSCRLKPITRLLGTIVFFLLVCFLLFTYNPPSSRIFEIPSPAQTKTACLHSPVYSCFPAPGTDCPHGHMKSCVFS